MSIDISNIKIAKSTFKIPSQHEIEQELNQSAVDFDELEAENEYDEYISNISDMINEGIKLNEQEQYDYQLYQKSITSADQTNIFKIQDKGYSVQKHDNSGYYVNFVNDVKYRSKQGIPQTKNIIPLKSFTIINKSTISGKKGVESYVDENNKYNDVSISTIIDNFDKGFYELLPYEGYNIYGCSLVKTCFNTIGKEHQYIHPFIDYDLEHNEYDFAGEIDVLLNLLNDYTKHVVQPDKTGKSNNHNFKISIIGYSNMLPKNEDYYELFSKNRYPNNYYYDNESYIKIQAKPDAPKALSVHIVFYDVKIECRELKHRVMENKDKLKEYKGFDIAPYLSGSLRHIASVKAGLTDTLIANSKRVDNLTSSEILHQLITYHNKYINYKYIELNTLHIKNKLTLDSSKFDKFKDFTNYNIEITYGNQKLNEILIESWIKELLTTFNVDVSFNSRWKLLSYYVMYKKAISCNITDDDISSLLPGEHTQAKNQIEGLNKIMKANPYPLLKYFKQLVFDNTGSGVNLFDFTVKSKSVYAHKSHFGQHKIEDLKNAKTFEDVIEIITGSFAKTDDGNLCYLTLKYNIHEFHITGKPNYYVRDILPSKFKILITLDELEFDETDEYESLSMLFKSKLEDLKDKNHKPQLRLSTTNYVDALTKYLDTYYEDAETSFKLNGYSIDKVKPEVYEDVKQIIKLFEDKLVEGCRTFDKPEGNENRKEIDNTLQEFLRSLSFLFKEGEKTEKLFLAIDESGSTGKSLFFSKIIKDLFGNAGLNDDCLKCLDSSFSDSYNYLYTVFNEVSKGKHDVDECSSYFKQLTDNIIKSSRVKNVQNMKSYKNKNIPVLLSNSFTLNGALNYVDSALMSRIVLIEFDSFKDKNDKYKIDTLEGQNYYSLVDKYKSFKDPNYTFNYDFRNALFKYIMDLDISTKTKGRAQPNKHKNETYQEIAKDELKEITKDKELKIYTNDIFSVNLGTNTLSKYNEESKYIGFKISDISRSKTIQTKLLPMLDYKTALYKSSIRYKLSDDIKNKYNDNRFKLVVCELSRLKAYVEIIESPPEINM